MFTVYSGRRLSTRARETKTMFTYSKPTPSIKRKRAAGHAGGGARARVAAGRVEGRRRNGAAPLPRTAAAGNEDDVYSLQSKATPSIERKRARRSCRRRCESERSGLGQIQCNNQPVRAKQTGRGDQDRANRDSTAIGPVIKCTVLQD